MLKQKSFLCLDFGAGSVKVAEFETNAAGSLLLKQYGIKALGLEGSQESKREGAVLKAVQELLSQKQYRAKNFNVSTPGFQVFSKFVKLPAVDSSKVTQIIQYEAQQNVPFPLEEAVWDYQIMGTLPSGELEVLLVAIKADLVEGLFRVSDQAGLKIDLVDIAPTALCNAFRFNYGDLEGCTMLLDIGAKTSNLLFFEKGKFFARSINIGANSITQDFVAESKKPFAKAEEIKLAEGFVSLGGAYEDPESPDAAAVSKIARQVMTRLHIQVNQTIQFYRGQQGGSAPQRVFLCGGGSIMAYTAQFFQEKLSLEIDYFNPFRNVEIDPSLDVEDLAKVAHSFGEVVGLGLRNLADCPVELNLVPKSIRSREAFNSKKPYFIATAFSLILVVAAFGLFYSKLADSKAESKVDLTSKLEPLEKKYEELDKAKKSVDRAKDELENYSDYLKDRFFWAEALVEMRGLLMKTEEKFTRPGLESGVWIEKFGTVSKDLVDEEEAEQSQQPGMGMMNMMSMMYYMRNPELMKRYFPQMAGMMGGAGKKEEEDAPATPSKPKPAVNTNTLTVNVSFRAVNLNKNGESAMNGKLAYAVQDAFKQSAMFDGEGTKLSGDLEQVEGTNTTFTFSMTLKLRNAMKL